MITGKELKYVTYWSSKTPYPGVAYAEQTAEKLLKAVETYEQFYMDRQYDLILSNGEQLEFEINCKNLCHMLGIDYKNLSNDYFIDFRSYYRRTCVRSYWSWTLFLNKIKKTLV